MDNYIFKEVTVLKKDFYQKFKDILIESGWQNISSNESTDFDVFYSPGESGNKNLYFQVRPTYVNNSSDITTTTGASMSMRLINRYVPGINGTSGAFDRPSEAWRYFNLFDAAVSLTAQVKITYHCNKNRIVVGLETSPTLGINGNVFLLGMPDNTFNEETDSNGLIFAPGVGYAFGSNSVMATNPSYKTTGSINHSMYSSLDLTGNIGKNFVISPIYYGDTTEGIRGVLDGIFLIKDANTLKSGDLIADGNKVYKFFNLLTPSSWSYYYPSRNILLRIK